MNKHELMLRINAADAQRQVIASGMNEYHKYTCIRFVPRSDEEDYIQIESNDGSLRLTY